MNADFHDRHSVLCRSRSARLYPSAGYLHLTPSAINRHILALKGALAGITFSILAGTVTWNG